MFSYILTRVYISAVLFHTVVPEPTCSKFSYEEKTLEKMIRTEIKVEQMEEQFAAARKELNEELVILRNEREALKTEVELLNKMQTEALTNFEVFKANLTELINEKDLDTANVYFQARDPTNKNPSTGNTIVFRTIISNIGNGYDANNGVFSASIEGVYAFSVQMCASTTHWLRYAIVKEDVPILPGWTYGSSYELCTSSTVYTHLSVGDRVWIKCTNGGTSGYLMYEHSTFAWNTFTGTFIHK